MKLDLLRTFGGRNTARALILLLAMAGLAHSGLAEKCSTCRKPITGEFFLFKSPALLQNQPLCKPCSTLDTPCFICKIPIKDLKHRLQDGRLLCESHARQAVFDQREVIRLFEQAKRELFPLLDSMGTLPQRNITVELVDAHRIAALAKDQHSAHEPTKVMGLARTTVDANGQFHHTLYLLNGLPPGRLMAVASHEYAHAWLHENLAADRRIDKNTVEGFCELVALQVMSRLNDETEKRVILQNAYTKGQIEAFVQAQDQHRFYQVVKWMKNGSETQVESGNANSVLATRSGSADRAPLMATWALPVVKTPVPDTLELKGITGSTQRPFALINNQTFAPLETAKVRVGSSNVMVKCLEIRKSSVLIQVEGSPSPAELSLTTHQP